ncbi:conserved hypothetical protein [Shewanella halifaxensis HAW-EB4]|uniref:Uncharacterized protein n=1 Tax=Shewanella halifaxensis (strain HAW-EB4) TaxID=458817 RepID=B0TK36_SHEHH|nr:hypothetical protein [Shewanella halifaxensis]ABZ77055.1 conserved hypothetical protein [Shewanella halifaxensis HAW-EB4]
MPRIYNKILFSSLLSSLLITLPSYSETSSDAVIFNYKPNCIEKELGSISLKTEDVDSLTQEDVTQDRSLSIALEQLRHIATKKGADALIITHVNYHITKYTEKFREASNVDAKHNRLNTQVQAQAYKMCTSDKSLSKEAAPYNAEGYIVHSFSYEYTINLDDSNSLSPFKLSRQIILPPANISIAKGVYGIKLGASIKETLEKLGPASIELMLEDKQIIMGYGRNLWFIFSKGKLSMVTSKLHMLNGAGLNAIGFREGFDDTRWKIEDVSLQNDDMKHVQLTLSSSMTQKSDNQLIIEENQQHLLLDFDKFHPEKASSSKQLLTHFTLTPINKSLDMSERPNLTSSQQEWLFERLAPQNGQTLTLDELKNHIPFANKLNIANDDNVWWLVSNNILLRFNDQQLEKVKLSDSLFYNTSDNTFISTINALKLPLEKQGMLAHFNDAIDNFEQVDIEREHFSILAKYESYDDNAALYELDIFYY